MKSGTTIKQRDIVLIPFPYSDLSTIKKRPVVIISNKNYHKNNIDVICCAITSNTKAIHRGVNIFSSDLSEGRLKVESIVKPGKIYSIQKDRIIKKIAKLNIPKTKEVIENLNLDIELD